MTYEFGVFEAASKEIITVDVTASEDIELGNQNFYIKNVVTTTKSGGTNKISEIICPVKIYDEYSISAASSSDVMGAASATPSGTVENGTSVTATATPITGYEFVNWTVGDTEKSTANPYTFSAAEDMALVANFKAKKYNVSFDVDGVSTSNDMDFGSTITAPADPTKTGYTFAGWEPAFVEGATVPVDGMKYTATWTINQYTITFDTDGGSDIPAITQDYATAVTAPANPTKTGYTFTGWDKEIPSTIPAENITVKAQWQINQYTITFDTDGGSDIPAITQDYATEVTEPANPTKTGYTFTGWDKEIPSTIPAENITVKAQWQINQYTITFDTDGGSDIPAITQDYATAVTAPANPTKTGYTFTGWDKEIPSTIPAENITVKAQWQINQYTITFDTDGGSDIPAITQDYATEVTEPANPTKTGYTFTGWDKEIPSTIPAENITVKAQWQINQYTITFDTDGGSDIPAITQDYATEVTAPANPTKTGYTFTGWDQEIPATIPAENITAKAQWQINQYSVKFVVDGNDVKSETLDYASVITAPADPVKTGYTFKGWNPAFVEGATVPANDVTYTAVWSVNQYTITFDTDGGSDIPSITQDYATEVTVPANPTKTGYTFTGWDQEIPATIPAENVTIKAQWQINQYSVKFVVDGNDVKSESLDYASVITAPESPVKTGYTFKGWNPAFVEGATVPANDVTYTAVWSVNQYTITFDTDGGSDIPSITQDYATEVTVPANPTKTGYTFTGWDKEIPATIPAENVTIKAQWQINQYSVKFVVDGNDVKSETLDYASDITAPADPEKTGYTFKGWNPAFVEGATVPANDVTYTAVWSVNQYTITFDTDGGTTIPAITQDYATAVTAPASPTKTGYTFAGWDKEIPSTIPAENITVKAQWTINQYTVKFVSDGEELKSESLDYASVITAPENPVKTGYTFKGWDPDFVEGATVPANDVTYTAVWEVNKYKLTYILDGTEVKVIEVEYGAAIEDFVPEVATGKIFDGWTDDIPETMPAHDLVINGKTAVDTFIRQHFAESNAIVPVYTISGTYVTTLTKAEDMNKLSRGTYIINGQKVIVNK